MLRWDTPKTPRTSERERLWKEGTENRERRRQRRDDGDAETQTRQHGHTHGPRVARPMTSVQGAVAPTFAFADHDRSFVGGASAANKDTITSPPSGTRSPATAAMRLGSAASAARRSADMTPSAAAAAAAAAFALRTRFDAAAATAPGGDKTAVGGEESTTQPRTGETRGDWDATEPRTGETGTQRHTNRDRKTRGPT